MSIGCIRVTSIFALILMSSLARAARAQAPASQAATSPAAARSQADYRGQLIELFEDRLLVQSDLKGKAWEQQARKLIRLTAASMADERVDPLVWPEDHPAPAALAAIADDLIRANCEDLPTLFCCMRAYARAWREADARKLVPKLDSIGNRKIPAFVVYFLKTELAALATDESAWVPAAQARTTNLLAMVSATRRPVNDAHLRLVAQLVLEDDSRYPSLEAGKTILDDAAGRGNASPWLNAILKGRCELRDARLWVQGDAADAADRKIRFEQHLSAAEGFFKTATKLDPQLPEGWSGLMTVAMFRDRDAQDEFEHGLAAEIDNEAIWKRMIDIAGSRGESALLAAGIRGAASNRYDTLAPLWYVRIVRTIDEQGLSADDARPIRKNAAVSARVAEILDQYIARSGKTARATRFAAFAANHMISLEQYDRAKHFADVFSALPHADNLPGLGASSPFWISMSNAMVRPDQAKLSEAQRAIIDGKPADVMKIVDPLLKQLPATDPSRLFLSHLQTLADRQTHFQAGDWVDLLPTPQMTAWDASEGDWRFVDGALNLATDSHPFAGRSFLFLHGPVEVSATFEYPSPTCENQAQLALWLIQPGHNSAAVKIYPLSGTITGLDGGYELSSVEVGPAAITQVTLLIDAGGASMSSGGKTMQLTLPENAVSMMKSGVYASIQQIRFPYSPQMHVIVRQLRARKAK